MHARNPNAPSPMTANSRPKNTPVAPMMPYPTTGASSPASSARPITGASHPGAAMLASEGFIKPFRNSGISGTSSARTTKRSERQKVGRTDARVDSMGRRETPVVGGDGGKGRVGRVVSACFDSCSLSMRMAGTNSRTSRRVQRDEDAPPMALRAETFLVGATRATSAELAIADMV